MQLHKGIYWRYGNFCGKDYPKLEKTAQQERIIELESKDPWKGDDIDAVCKQHDICYERHGRNHYLCDLVLTHRLNEMKFEGENKPQCQNIRDQALYYFLSFHPTRCPGALWMTRLRLAPLIGGIMPLALALSTRGTPDQPCKSTTPISTSMSEEQRSPDSTNSPGKPETIVNGYSIKQVVMLFKEEMLFHGYTLKEENDDSLLVFGIPLEPTEPGRDSPDIRLTFTITADDDDVIHIFGDAMSIVVNHDSPFAYRIDSLMDAETYNAVQRLLDSVKVAIGRSPRTLPN